MDSIIWLAVKRPKAPPIAVPTRIPIPGLQVKTVVRKPEANAPIPITTVINVMSVTDMLFAK